MKHTPGPWAIEESKRGAILYIKARDGQVAQTYGEGDFYRTQYPNARRIVACVNGCEGINPDAVADLLAALKNVISRVYLPEGWEQDVVDAIAKATEER